MKSSLTLFAVLLCIFLCRPGIDAKPIDHMTRIQQVFRTLMAPRQLAPSRMKKAVDATENGAFVWMPPDDEDFFASA
ncbi:hypothetical protein AAVH_11219 [Aphelenchoides avenae]|nr:hypothetical protein AAVH_11219 [Aphelenchus avenae]